MGTPNTVGKDTAPINMTKFHCSSGKGAKSKLKASTTTTTTATSKYNKNSHSNHNSNIKRNYSNVFPAAAN